MRTKTRKSSLRARTLLDYLEPRAFLTNNGTGGQGLKNIRVIRPRYAANTTQVFTTAFLNSIAPFQTIRFMDFLATNDNQVVNWADRSHTTDARQATLKGGSWEYAIQL